MIVGAGEVELGVRIFNEADARGMLVHVLETPALCNFTLPEVTRIGPVAVAISAAGAAPALSKRMAREIESLFGQPYAMLAILMGAARDWARRTIPTDGAAAHSLTRSSTGSLTRSSCCAPETCARCRS